jgi:hypothetical protein
VVQVHLGPPSQDASASLNASSECLRHPPRTRPRPALRADGSTSHRRHRRCFRRHAGRPLRHRQMSADEEHLADVVRDLTARRGSANHTPDTTPRKLPQRMIFVAGENNGISHTPTSAQTPAPAAMEPTSAPTQSSGWPIKPTPKRVSRDSVLPELPDPRSPRAYVERLKRDAIQRHEIRDSEAARRPRVVVALHSDHCRRRPGLGYPRE